jgi:hypothetical protein
MGKNDKSKKRPVEKVAPRPHRRTEIMQIIGIAVPVVIALFMNAYSVFKPAPILRVPDYR